MIRFQLRCDDGHGFESWFRDNASHDEQVRAGLVNCPVCGSDRVEKAIMAPHVARVATPERDGARQEAPHAATGQALAAPDAADKALRDLVRAMRRHVEATTEPVGARFAEEAIAMHHGEIDHRPIRGSATAAEVRQLRDEGVGFQPLPFLPDDRN
ncbi:MAG: DUF1178 family protein [Bosea sp.]|jgi:hypothetical protein|nr:DUF1178 family protein [Bosea sp. (in: a-proteobacteria)]